MITITEQLAKEAGRCQGCTEKSKKVFVILTEPTDRNEKRTHVTSPSPIVYELRLCSKCLLNELREKIDNIVPF